MRFSSAVSQRCERRWMPLRTCTFRAPSGEMWIRDVDYELLARSVQERTNSVATSGAQSDVDASRLTGPIQTNSSRAPAAPVQLLDAHPCVAHHAIRAVSGRAIVDSTRERRARRSKQQRVSLVARHGPIDPGQRLASTPGDPAASVRDAVRTIGDPDAAAAVWGPRAASLRTAASALIRSSDSSRPSRELGDALQRLAEWLDATWESRERRLLRVASAANDASSLETSSCEPVNLGPSFAFRSGSRQMPTGFARISRLSLADHTA